MAGGNLRDIQRFHEKEGPLEESDEFWTLSGPFPFVSVLLLADCVRIFQKFPLQVLF